MTKPAENLPTGKDLSGWNVADEASNEILKTIEAQPGPGICNGQPVERFIEITETRK